MININYLSSFNGEAIISNERIYTYNDLFNKIKIYEQLIEKFINCRIAVIGDFNFETISLLLAFRNSSNIFIPIIQTTDLEVKRKIKDSNVNFIFKLNPLNNDFIIEDVTESVIDCKDMSGLILFSSGTTGEPKMMFHDFDKLFSVLNYSVKKQRNLKILLFLMFDHIGGINTLLNCLKDGSTIVITNDRNPFTICKIINKYNIHVLPTTPTFLNLMLMSEIDFQNQLKSLKLITYGTERMPQIILQKLKKELPNVKLLQTFGTSETGILKTVSKSSDSLFFKIEDDRYQYKIVDNVLLIKSSLNINGYLNIKSDKFDQDGWYNTGDLVEIDQEGYIMVIGRINEVINIGGQKVLPAEIEEVLLSHEGIQDCLIYGKNNVITGQSVCAKLVLNDVYQNKNESEIKSIIKTYCREKLDKYKVPTKIEIVDKLKFTTRYKKVLNV
jgi:acyl-coenzyme A synthetase/AMP-(fatty) acid ligase